MNSEQEAGVLTATKHLQLESIILWSARFDRPAPELPPDGTQARLLHKRGIKYQISGDRRETDPEQHLRLQVLVQLGLRLAANEADQDSAPVYVQIEADFMVTYRLQAEIEDPALSAFSNFNAVHNVWPFWRQHVFDIVQRGELPNIEVPLFAGTKS